jgi:hypothetical protein
MKLQVAGGASSYSRIQMTSGTALAKQIRDLVCLILPVATCMIVEPALWRLSAQSNPQNRPMCKVDVRSFGFKTSIGTKPLQHFIDFTDSEHIGVAWVSLDDPTTHKSGLFVPVPAHLNVLILDAHTGKQEVMRNWAAPSIPVRFAGLGYGNSLTCTGNVVRLLSPSLGVEREETISGSKTCSSPQFSGVWGFSPSRKSFLVSTYSGPKQSQDALLGTGSFALLAAWTEQFPIQAISDHWLAAYCGKQRGLCVRKADEPWQPFQAALIATNDKSYPASAAFADDETLVTTMGNSLQVATVDGAVIFRADLKKNERFTQIVNSRGGRRFAVIESRFRGVTNEALDMYAFLATERATVYSIPDRTAIYSVNLKGDSPWFPFIAHKNDIALSPDGSLLAVLSDGILQIFQISTSDTTH